jgi:cytidine deaminase
VDWAPLITAATEARERAYAPYSNYRVGAALRTASGAIFTGCNVENASYGLALCAERAAVAAMIASGERTPSAIVVVTGGDELGSPCGLCRQTLVEFSTDLPIGLSRPNAISPEKILSLAQLFPLPFRGDLVR